MTQPILEVRQSMVNNGFKSIIPVVGKKPPLDEWQKFEDVSRAMLEEWERDWPGADNTGICTKFVPTFDLDIRTEAAAVAAENMIREQFSDRGKILVRIGLAPKRAIPFRIKGDPFKKRKLNFEERTPGAGSEAIELLGDGQQFVSDGIHPDTQKPYVWIGGSPTTVRYDELPEISQGEAHALQDAIADMLRNDFGYVTYFAKALTKRQQKKLLNAAKPMAEVAPANPERDLKWAQAALEAECAALADAPEGDRNNQLNKSSFAIFQIVHGNPGLLDEQEVRDRLFAAAVDCGLVTDDGEESVWRTIESGEAGAETQPRKRPLSKMELPAAASLNGGLDIARALADLTTSSSLEDTLKDLPRTGTEIALAIVDEVMAGDDDGDNDDDDVGLAPEAGVAAGGRRPVPLIKGNFHDAADAAEETLFGVEWCNIYQRGGLLVRPVKELMEAADNRETMVWRLTPVTQPYLMEMFERVASFITYDRRYDPPRWVVTNCPDRVGKMVLARRGHWQASILLGIVNTPPFQPDGTLMTTPGYDPKSWLLFNPDGEVFPEIPDRPTRKQALRGLRLLKKLIRKFPFKTEADRSVALSMFLCGLCRRAIKFAPLHGMSATAAGTGKSKLVDLASILMTGRDAPVISLNVGRDEVEKRVGAALLAGDPLITFDNCDGPLHNALINQMLSQRWVKIRVLGVSHQPDAPTSSLVCATGNGLTVEGDLTRRTIRCELDAGVERPEMREFSFEPTELFRKHRAKLVAAALTVIRAGRVAEALRWPGEDGTPTAMPAPLGGFVQWSGWVRNPLIWLGCADPCDTMERVYVGDPAREMHIGMLNAWKTAFGVGTEFRAQQLIEKAGEYNQGEFRNALLMVAKEQGSSGAINAKRLGLWLAKVEGKICEQLYIRRSRVSGGTALWKLEALK